MSWVTVLSVAVVPTTRGRRRITLRRRRLPTGRKFHGHRKLHSIASTIVLHDSIEGRANPSFHLGRAIEDQRRGADRPGDHGPHVAMLATSNADGRPQSSVIFVKRYGRHGGVKHDQGQAQTRNMARDPWVSLLVVAKDTRRYVKIRGSVDITDDPEKRLL